MSDYEEEFAYSQDDFAALDAAEARLRSPEPTTGSSLLHTSTSTAAATEQSADPSLLAPALEFDLNSIDWYAAGSDGLDQDGLASGESISGDKSLFQRFRPWNSLAVTDLSAPGFCEVKHRYNLLGKRHLAPEKRPTSVRRKDGKEIMVDKSLQATADRVMDAGKAIHKKLELEVHPEQRVVVTDTRADRVALRLINMLVNLSVLKHTGISREIPVHGYLNGFYVSGIIDEVQKRPLPKKESAKGKGKAPVQKNNLGAYFNISPAKSKPAEPTHELVLTDHKTRGSQKMPHSTWTKPNRIQLMTYKAMWDTLAKDAFDWDIFYKHHRVDPSAELSDDFRQEMQPLLLAPDLSQVAQATSLDQTVQVVRAAFQEAGTLSSAMEIVYRSRQFRQAANSKSRSLRVPEVSFEDQDLQSAIALSLQADGTKGEETSGQSNGTSSSELSDLSDASLPLSSPRRSKRLKRANAGAGELAAASTKEEEGVIGVERFDFFQSELDAWLQRMGSYWRSEREPQGVAAQDVSFKCRSCEYSDNCEWLEAKAAQAAEESKARRLEREASRQRSASVVPDEELF